MSAHSIKILRSDERSVTISFTAQKWASNSIEINGEVFTLVDFPGANFVDTPGSPQIPYHVVIVGIPIDANVRYRILESDYEVQNGVKLLPFPEIKKVEDWVEKEFILNQDIYGRSEPFPSQIVKIDEPAFFRDQQIARIQVAGIQYLPGKNQILKYNRVVLEIDFVGGKQTVNKGSIFPTKTEERLYKSVLLNYEQAARWRKTRTIKPYFDKGQSIFNNGPWYKIKIQEEGMYRIDGQFLESNGINLSEIEPAKIRLYNNGGRELPRDINAPRPSGLIENAIIVEDGGDGRFDRDDFILFYGIGVEGWDYDSQSKSYSHYINHYGFDNVYWLTWGGEENGKRVSTLTSGPPSGNITETYQGRVFVEEEKQNPLRSGLNWFGWEFAIDEVSRSKTFNFDLANAVPSDSVFLKFRFASKTSGIHRFSLSFNGRPIGNLQFSGAGSELSGFLAMRISDFALEAENVVLTGTNTLEISYSASTDIGQALLDWFEIFYTAQLRAVEDELAFTVFPESGLQTYRISNFTQGSVELFDVTEFFNVKKIAGTSFSNGSLTFTDSQVPNLPKRYLALNPAKYKSVQSIERMEITDLRNAGMGAEFVIITHEDFYSEALRLESLRENGSPDNRLQTEVVRITDVYNNFSGSLVDPTAIRDFLKYAYENWTTGPAYVLLFGDGDYDYKNILSGGDKNWIPTFQTDELPQSRQLRELESRTTDSWFT
ncbi:MAG: C25 family cysteine peptidase, partial [bacterium]